MSLDMKIYTKIIANTHTYQYHPHEIKNKIYKFFLKLLYYTNEIVWLPIKSQKRQFSSICVLDNINLLKYTKKLRKTKIHKETG